MQADYHGIKFTDADIVNPEDFVPSAPKGMAYNPHRVHGYLLHDHGFCLAVVFASCLQDAIDIAADEGKLDRYAVSLNELADYGEDGEGLAYLGNASEPFDIDSLSVEELPTPAFSFVALFNVHNSQEWRTVP